MNSSVREAKRVVLCDDHEIVREAIKARMANSSVVEIVGEAGNGRDVVDVVKELEPDVEKLCSPRIGAAGREGTADDAGESTSSL